MSCACEIKDGDIIAICGAHNDIVRKEVAHEREMCALYAEAYALNKYQPENTFLLWKRGEKEAAQIIADKIREA